MIQIVKFRNGTYAVRKGLIFFRYLNNDYGDDWWWTPYYVEESQLSSYEAAALRLKAYNDGRHSSKKDYGTPVNTWKGPSY